MSAERPNYAEGGEWLDGPTLAEWLGRQMPAIEWEGWTATIGRMLCSWRKGERVRFYTLDRYLCRLGLTPHEIPDKCWLTTAEYPTHRGECRNGHPRSERNTRVQGTGKLVCLDCRRESKRRRTAKRPPSKLPVGPLAVHLVALHKRHGTWEATGAAVGLSTSAVCRYAQAEYPTVLRRTAERILGEDFHRIYDEVAA